MEISCHSAQATCWTDEREIIQWWWCRITETSLHAATGKRTMFWCNHRLGNEQIGLSLSSAACFCVTLQFLILSHVQKAKAPLALCLNLASFDGVPNVLPHTAAAPAVCPQLAPENVKEKYHLSINSKASLVDRIKSVSGFTSDSIPHLLLCVFENVLEPCASPLIPSFRR